ncbi:RDD family protein [Marinobacterium zhoushanense]|uniref:RDD family protein n=1 Tax=Marinobacterium zhoushanense TaxID=1679163 RepID=A0ABQ1KUQ4_9GAMM|nr:RDD family protein [Marinobacterium zhoushanense]GGC06158.1 RDD family protein [Marinobacterium zhoushanense]
MRRPFREEISDIRPASFGKRLLAMLYDFLILVSIWLGVAIIATAINQGAVDSAMGRAAMQSAQFCFSFLFFAYFWTRNGQTLGMQAWRLRVQTFDGQRLNWTQALIRFLCAIISWLPLGLGYFWMLFSDERLTWHDRWSESCVVSLPKKARDK